MRLELDYRATAKEESYGLRFNPSFDKYPPLMKAWVGFRIVDHSTGNSRDVVLGDFDEVYHRGITIGGFADCSVHLDGPSATGVRARFSGGSNHRFLTVESAPASSPLFVVL